MKIILKKRKQQEQSKYFIPTLILSNENFKKDPQKHA